jgi:hypothetical protein
MKEMAKIGRLPGIPSDRSSLPSGLTEQAN